MSNTSFWLSRDRAGGVLSDVVEVWLVRPVAVRHIDGDTTWVAPLDVVDRRATYVAAVDVAFLEHLAAEALEFEFA